MSRPTKRDNSPEARKRRLENLAHLLSTVGNITHQVVSEEEKQDGRNSNNNHSFGYNRSNYSPPNNSSLKAQQGITNNNNNDPSSPTRSLFNTGAAVNRAKAGFVAFLDETSSSSFSATNKSAQHHHQQQVLSKDAEINDCLIRAKLLLAQKPKDLNDYYDEEDEKERAAGGSTIGRRLSHKRRQSSGNNNTTGLERGESQDFTKLLQRQRRNTLAAQEESLEDIRRNSRSQNHDPKNEVKDRIEKMLSFKNMETSKNFGAMEKSLSMFFGGGDDDDDDDFYGSAGNFSSSGGGSLSRQGSASFRKNNKNHQKMTEEEKIAAEEKQKREEYLFSRHHARCEAATAAGTKIERVFSLIPLDDPDSLE